MKAESPSLTTAELQDHLAAKYPRDRYALFFDVPDNVGTHQRRRADAIAVGCWNSVGHLIEGFELKVSRADWLRELKSVNKADPFIERCDRWWLVTASPAIAKVEEIPACWGWMAYGKGGLRVQRPAPRLPQHKPEEIGRLFAVGLFRKMQDDLLNSPEVQRVIKEKRDEVEKRIEEQVTYRTQHNNRRVEELQKVIDKFESESGIKLAEWKYGHVGKIVKSISDLSYGGDGLTAVAQELARQEDVLNRMLENIREARKGFPPIQEETS